MVRAALPTGNWLRAQRLTLVAGAFYDLAVAALTLLAPAFLEARLGVPRPGHDFYLHLIAVFLTTLAALYLVGAYDLRRLREVPLIATLARSLGAGVLGLAATLPGLQGLAPLAAVDFLLAILHATFYFLSRRDTPH
jgi:hypothetical protein